MPVKVKICGVTDPANALEAVELGADYLGLNFYPGSPRFVGAGRALEIAEAVAGRVPLVGVFVNAPAAEIEETAGRVGLDFVQFSGDEGPDAVAPFAGRAIKAFRTGGAAGPRGDRGLRHPLGSPDRRTSWFALRRHGGGLGLRLGAPGAAPERLFLAGGLGPDNVRAGPSRPRGPGVSMSAREWSPLPGSRMPSCFGGSFGR